MAVLEVLAARAPEVVSRKELMDTVWAGTVVGDEALTRCISELRSIFGDDRNAPTFIQTIPKAGYRLLAEPRPITPTRPWMGVAAGLVAASLVLGAITMRLLEEAEPEPSVAILPFATLAEDRNAGHFGSGLAEEILNTLINVDGLRVASRHSSFQHGADANAIEIGRTLGVGHVLTGTVRRDTDSVRVVAQLVNSETGSYIWSERFERPSEDLFAIQDEIALAITDALQIELSAPLTVARISSNIDALDLYLLGRHHWHQRTPESLARAVEFFRQALELDPRLAHAYSGLADAYLLLANYGDLPIETAIDNAAPAVEAALAIDPQLAEAQASLGMLMLDREDFVSAEQAFARAVELDPHYDMAQMWLANALSAQGRIGEAHAHYMAAFAIEPSHPVVRQNALSSMLMVGDYDGAENIVRDFDLTAAHVGMLKAASMLAIDRGRLREARDFADELARRGHTDAGAWIHWRTHSILGEWEAGEQWVTRASANTDGHHGEAYLFQLEHYALTGNLTAFEQLVADHDSDHYRFAETAWRGIYHVYQGEYADAEALLSSVAGERNTKDYLPFRFTLLGHLLFACEQTGNLACMDHWRAQGPRPGRSVSGPGLGLAAVREGAGVLLRHVRRSPAGRRSVRPGGGAWTHGAAASRCRPPHSTVA